MICLLFSLEYSYYLLFYNNIGIVRFMYIKYK